MCCALCVVVRCCLLLFMIVRCVLFGVWGLMYVVCCWLCVVLFVVFFLFVVVFVSCLTLLVESCGFLVACVLLLVVCC